MVRKRALAARRAARVRARIVGTAECPRLSVSRSLKHISAQLIDDVSGKTLAAASDRDVSTKGARLPDGQGSASGGKDMKPVEIARAVGKTLAERAKAKGIGSAAFDRGSRRYHGRVAALADGAREGGIEM